MLHRTAIGAGITAGLLIAVLLTTALDHGGADAIAPPIRGLLIAAFVVCAVTAVLVEIAERIRRTDEQLREMVVNAVHDEIADALADAYRAGSIMTAGTAPVLRSVAND
jgi:hypothetical protein